MERVENIVDNWQNTLAMRRPVVPIQTLHSTDRVCTIPSDNPIEYDIWQEDHSSVIMQVDSYWTRPMHYWKWATERSQKNMATSIDIFWLLAKSQHFRRERERESTVWWVYMTEFRNLCYISPRLNRCTESHGLGAAFLLFFRHLLGWYTFWWFLISHYTTVETFS